MDTMTPKATHTPEPWTMDLHYVVAPDPAGVYPDIYIAEIAGEDSSEPPRIAPPEQQIANGRRLVAAVNACKGIPTHTLEEGVIEELLEMLDWATEILEEWLVGAPRHADTYLEALTMFQFTLAAARGELP